MTDHRTGAAHGRPVVRPLSLAAADGVAACRECSVYLGVADYCWYCLAFVVTAPGGDSE